MRRACLALAGAAALILAGRADAESVPVDLELIIAVDVSDSIDLDEAHLQRQGYIAALADPEIMQAIASGPYRRIAMTYFEWAESNHQRTVVDWTLIEGPAEAQRFAKSVSEAPYERRRWTSISGALDFAVRRFAESRFDGTRKVIDISGDGSNNHGRDVAEAREEALAAGITINGLPILTERLSRYGWPRSADVDYYYEHSVIGGPGAFMVIVESSAAVADAIRRKLLREIAGERAGPERLARLRDD